MKKELQQSTWNNMNVVTEDNKGLLEVQSTVSMIFNIIIIISMSLCFFSLSSSTSANLYDQQKEIGILRALGFTRLRIIMLYCYESLILVMASSILGVFVGTIAAFTMVAQFSAFSGLPLVFYFPGPQILLIILAATLCALASTVGPSQSIVKHKIASILRAV
jgi:ABC-type antimicrobial peptide transport system permease subunit